MFQVSSLCSNITHKINTLSIWTSYEHENKWQELFGYLLQSICSIKTSLDHLFSFQYEDMQCKVQSHVLYHLVTLLVNSTGELAAIDLGSELDIHNVYMSEKRASFEETAKPVLLNDPCNSVSNPISETG